MPESLQALVEILQRRLIGRPVLGADPRLSRVGCGLVPRLAPEGVLDEPLDLLVEAARVEPLHRLEDVRVEVAAALVEERPVRDLVGQRVLEGVLDLGEEARLVEELAGLQADEPVAEHVRVEPADGLQEWQRHVLPDGGGRLQQMLVR